MEFLFFPRSYRKQSEKLVLLLLCALLLGKTTRQKNPAS